MLNGKRRRSLELPRFSIEFEPRDIWFGLYINTKKKTAYLCLIPMFPLVIDYSESGNSGGDANSGEKGGPFIVTWVETIPFGYSSHIRSMNLDDMTEAYMLLDAISGRAIRQFSHMIRFSKTHLNQQAGLYEFVSTARIVSKNHGYKVIKHFSLSAHLTQIGVSVPEWLPNNPEPLEDEKLNLEGLGMSEDLRPPSEVQRAGYR